MNNELKNLDEDENMGIKREYIDIINEHWKDDIPRIDLNNNKPIFTEDDKKRLEGNVDPFTDLDDLDRCGVAFTCISYVICPENQKNRPNIKCMPTGFPTKNFINNHYIFQRCHLIGHQLFTKKNNNENSNKINLFTGTRLMNHEMLHYENMVADYVKKTGNHVLYRVTPYFKGKNMLVHGVQMEAESINSKDTKELFFNIFVYNKQPGIRFDYKTGKIFIDKSKKLSRTMLKTKRKYIINEKNKSFHIENCASVYDIKSKNEVSEKGEDLIQKYCPCGICIPY